MEELQQRGYPVFFGALGENLTTRGIDVRQLRIGDRLRAGGALLEITQPRGPCASLDIYGPTIKQEIYDKRVKALDPSSPRWGMSGFYLSVVEPGPVAAGRYNCSRGSVGLTAWKARSTSSGLAPAFPERIAARIQLLLASVPDPDAARRSLERLLQESPSAFDRITSSPAALRCALRSFLPTAASWPTQS